MCWIGSATSCSPERFCDALQVGLAAVRAEPLRESAHRLLVRVHLREGNVAEAIRQYRSYADLLRRELHATPSPVIQRLPDAVLGWTVN